MTTVVTTVCVVLALLTALAAGIHAARDQAPNRLEFVGAAVSELGVLVYVVVRAVDLAQGHHVSSLALFIAYLVGIVLVLPVAVLLSLAEPTRWGSVVIVVGALTVCVLFARIGQLWTPNG